MQEDASLAVFLLLSLALGVVIVTLNGIDIEQLMTFLFGETAARMSTDKLLVIAVSATVSLFALALIYRPLVLGCVDPGFLRSVSRADGVAHLIFLALLVLNLVSGFHALGTLLGVGIIIIPAGIARFWTRDISKMIALAVDQRADLGLCRAAVCLSRRNTLRPGGDARCRPPLYRLGCVRAGRRAHLARLPGPPSGGLIGRGTICEGFCFAPVLNISAAYPE